VLQNLGWPLANGTFLHFLDDDDILAERHYVAMKSTFEKHPTSGLVGVDANQRKRAL
jgi:hypothetical protein